MNFLIKGIPKTPNSMFLFSFFFVVPQLVSERHFYNSHAPIVPLFMYIKSWDVLVPSRHFSLSISPLASLQ